MKFVGATLALGPVLAAGSTTALSQTKPPNVIIIMSDDMGMNDIEPFGQTIVKTPALTRLAQEGVRFSNFHVLPVCSPTRAQLLTGVDIHLAGLGNMAEVRNPKAIAQGEGYRGILSDRVKTIAEVLKEGGYSTFMSGKWHLGGTEKANPPSRGFDRSYVLADGGGSHWDQVGLLAIKPKSTYLEDGKPTERPAGVFSSDMFADKFLGYLQDALRQNKPFFGYLAFQAVHDPLHAPKASMEKYKGKFSSGYDAYRKEIFERMKTVGVISPSATMWPVPPLFKPWADLTSDERKHQERLMEVYAGMLDNMDMNIERVLSTLRAAGVYDNTVIIFLSDNGPSPVYMDLYPGNADGKWISQTFDLSFDNIGGQGSFFAVGPGWATGSSAPFRLFKSFLTEGGTRSPLIVKAPGAAKPGRINNSFVGVEDIFPTLTALTRVERGDSRNGVPLAPLKGASIVPTLLGEQDVAHGPDYERGDEFWGQKVYRKGDWKLLWLPRPFGSGEWQLYQTQDDPGETLDRAAAHPTLVAELSKKYQRWAEAHNVMEWDYPFLHEKIFDFADWTKGMRSQVGAR
jgi:arylsulfatase